MSRHRWGFVAAALAVAIVGVAPGVPASAGPVSVATSDEARFPHAKHAGLFPSCNGCHGGVLGADTAAAAVTGPGSESLYPTPAQCAGCHDGTVQPRVNWDGPRRDASNLRFSHAVHNREADLGNPEFNCTQCHQQRGATAFMAVAEARPQACIACHAHMAPEHLATVSPCQTCHVPVARATALTVAQVREFPRPADHDQPGFIAAHGPTVAVAQQRCATCHARESCARCHANAAAVPQIAALEGDARVASLVAGLPAAYAIPASHQRADWAYAHGREAATRIASCSNCHTQPGCTTCHTGQLGAAVIAQLPAGGPGAGGVQLRSPEPAMPPSPVPVGARHETTSDGDVMLQGGPSDAAARDTTPRIVTTRDTSRRTRVHPPGFETGHGAAAASQRASCSGCHEAQRFCTACHAGEAPRRYHPANFVARHPSAAYAMERSCTSCHSREAFCTACHQRSGMASEGRRDVAFHTAQPLWLIQHGRAARQGLETCTTCHVQRDCTQCHSQATWGVNPHGPGFNPGRIASRNAQTCRACHLGDPLTRPP